MLHVVDREPLQTLIRLVPGLTTRPEAEVVAAARARLHELAGSLGRRDGLQATIHVCAGSPYSEIAACVETVKPDLLVMGSHGEHPAGSGLAGATAQKTARAVRCPVLLVRNDARRRYRDVLVPVDLSPESHRPLAVAVGIAPGASLYVLHAHNPAFEDKAFFANASREALAHYRKAVAAELREHIDRLIERVELGAAVATRLVRRGHAPHVIAEAIADLDIDLVVMNAREHSELSRFFLGSVAQHIMAEAPTDVLLVR